MKSKKVIGVFKVSLKLIKDVLKLMKRKKRSQEYLTLCFLQGQLQRGPIEKILENPGVEKEKK